MNILLFYLLCINFITFITFGIDKSKARQKKWRIPEKRLFALAIAGGSVGAEMGMLCFRHKTKHARFTIGIPLILTAQVALIIYLL